MAETQRNDFYCSVASEQLGEQLYGTATRVDVWLLLSYAAPFGRKAFDEADLPVPVRAHLVAASRAIPNTRLQLIRRGARTAERAAEQAAEGVVFYVALAKELNPVLYRFDLARYEDLVEIDLRAVADGDPRFDGFLGDQPLFLVCTNGTHDRCCARSGLPVFTQMAARTGIDVWQTSHLGGHRFAANVVCLPHGVMYGRVAPADVTPVVAEHLQRTVLLDKLRGRSCYDAAVQVAEYYVRQRTGNCDLQGLRLLQSEPRGTSGSMVTFLSTVDGVRHRAHVERDVGVLRAYTSCAAAHESALDQYRLVSLRKVNGQTEAD